MKAAPCTYRQSAVQWVASTKVTREESAEDMDSWERRQRQLQDWDRQQREQQERERQQADQDRWDRQQREQRDQNSW